MISAPYYTAHIIWVIYSIVRIFYIPSQKYRSIAAIVTVRLLIFQLQRPKNPLCCFEYYFDSKLPLELHLQVKAAFD